jgi:hypothetical protein
MALIVYDLRCCVNDEACIAWTQSAVAAFLLRMFSHTDCRPSLCTGFVF